MRCGGNHGWDGHRGTRCHARGDAPDFGKRTCRGFGEIMRVHSIALVKTAILSRALAGTRGSSLIINFAPASQGRSANAWRYWHRPFMKQWRICAGKTYINDLLKWIHSDAQLIICASRSRTGATSAACIACRRATRGGSACRTI